MQKAHAVRVLLVSLIPAFACAPTAESGPSVEQIQADIRAASEEMISNEIALNFEAVESFYAADALFQGANSPTVSGRQAIMEDCVGFFTSTLEMEASVTEVVASASGDVAFEWGTNRFVVDTPEGPTELRGKYSRGWRKIEGVWRVQLQTYSPDVIPPA